MGGIWSAFSAGRAKGRPSHVARRPALVSAAVVLTVTMLNMVVGVTPATAAATHSLSRSGLLGGNGERLLAPDETEGQAIVADAQGIQNQAYPQESFSSASYIYCWDGGTTTEATAGTNDPTGGGTPTGGSYYSNCNDISRVGFDCRGLALYAVYQGTNGTVTLPASTAQAQYSDASSYDGSFISLSSVQPGDLVFFGSSSSDIEHVGIVVSGTGSSASIISAISENYGITTETVHWFKGEFTWVGAVAIPNVGSTSGGPNISSVSPDVGPIGTQVTLSGSALANASSVTFNAVSATISGDTASTITTSVPNGATTGNIVVTTPYGTASAGFTVENSWVAAFVAAGTDALTTCTFSGSGECGGYNETLGIAPGTSPSITELSGGDWVAAFVAAGTDDLTTCTFSGSGKCGGYNESLRIAPKTSPSIASLPNGDWVAAFVGTGTDALTTCTFSGSGECGGYNESLRIAPKTSPSITSLPNGDWVAAFVAAGTDALTTCTFSGSGECGGYNETLGIAPKTSPSITSLPNGDWVAAFVGTGAGDLTTCTFSGSGECGGYNETLGIASKTSPSTA